MDDVQPNNQSHLISLAIDFIANNFNGILTIIFFFFGINPTVSDDLMCKIELCAT